MSNTNITASAFVKNNKLYIMGLQDEIPFTHVCECQAKDGPVDFGSDLNVEVQAAIDNSQNKILEKIEREKIRLAAEELVDRTRAGDQNAAAMMIMVKRNAEKGNQRAQLTLDMMNDYASGNSTIHGDSSIKNVLSEEIKTDDNMRTNAALTAFLPGMTFLQAVVTLSHGPSLTNTRIKGLVNEFTNEERHDFFKGFKHWGKKPPRGYMIRLGQTIGFARAIQLCRMPNTPISVLSKKAEMELS